MTYLSKILPLLVLPIGITIFLILGGIILRRRWLLVAAVIFLWFTSIPLVGSYLARAAEEWAVRRPATEAPAADAIVVLSGGRIVAPGAAAISEWSDPDRFFGGLELFEAGKAPLIIFTAAWSPWEPPTRSEGEILADYAKTLGVPPASIVITGRVFNTAEEAREVAAIMKARQVNSARVLVVTSAFHMPRARQVFTSAGLTVEPFPVDFSVSEAGLDVMDFVPTSRALVNSQNAMRELYGRLYYRLKPW